MSSLLGSACRAALPSLAMKLLRIRCRAQSRGVVKSLGTWVASSVVRCPLEYKGMQDKVRGPVYHRVSLSFDRVNYVRHGHNKVPMLYVIHASLSSPDFPLHFFDSLQPRSVTPLVIRTKARCATRDL